MSPGSRVGWGYDAHALVDEPPLLLGGVVVSATRGVAATSDGDVAAHAITDAVLGGAALGDIGDHFPSSDPAWAGADSMAMLAAAVAMARDAGWAPTFADVTVVAESVRISPHREAIRGRLAAAMSLDVDSVSVKATSTDGLGFIGREEGLAVTAVVTMGGTS